MSKKFEYDSCGSSIECLSPMSCTGGKCQCSSTEYFVLASLICVPRTLNNTSCATDNTCRVDLGLTCQSNICQCDMSTKFWHSTQANCINFMTYSQTGCTVDANCLASQNLICNTDPTAKMCDCAYDYYWNSGNSQCELRTGYFTYCSSSVDSCVRNFTCRDSRCICPVTQAYRKDISACVNCNNNDYGYDERCYTLHTSQTGWLNAETICESQTPTGWLAVPSDQREYQKLYSARSTEIWIGYHSNTMCSGPSSFTVFNSAESIYVNWDTTNGKPDCSNDDRCATIRNGGFDNDDCSTEPHEYYCEYSPA